jgi:hypothetical protein
VLGDLLATNQLGTTATMASEPRAFDAAGLLLCYTVQDCAEQGEKMFNMSGKSDISSTTGSFAELPTALASVIVLVFFGFVVLYVRSKTVRRTLSYFGGIILSPTSEPAAKRSFTLVRNKQRRALQPDVLQFEEQESPAPCEGELSDLPQESVVASSVDKSIESPGKRAPGRASFAAGILWNAGISNDAVWRSWAAKPAANKDRGKSSASLPSVTGSLVFATRSSLSPDPFWSAQKVDWSAATSGAILDIDPGHALNSVNAMQNLNRALQQQPAGLPQHLISHLVKQAASSAASAAITTPRSSVSRAESSTLATTMGHRVFRSPSPARIIPTALRNEPKLVQSHFHGGQRSRFRVSLSEPLPGTSAAAFALKSGSKLEITPRPSESRERPEWSLTPLGTPREILLARSPRRAVTSIPPSKAVQPGNVKAVKPEPAPAGQVTEDSARSFLSPPVLAPSLPQRARTAEVSSTSNAQQQQAGPSSSKNASMPPGPLNQGGIGPPRFIAPPQPGPARAPKVADSRRVLVL